MSCIAQGFEALITCSRAVMYRQLNFSINSLGRCEVGIWARNLRPFLTVAGYENRLIVFVAVLLVAIAAPPKFLQRPFTQAVAFGHSGFSPAFQLVCEAATPAERGIGRQHM